MTPLHHVTNPCGRTPSPTHPSPSVGIHLDFSSLDGKTTTISGNNNATSSQQNNATTSLASPVPSPANANAPASHVSFKSPKMAFLFKTCHSKNVLRGYYGPFSFLDSDSEFVAAFGKDPV